MKPPSARPWRNPANRCVVSSGDRALRNPITGIAGCCARAPNGHVAAAPLRSVMNSRRRISAPKLRRPHCTGSNEYFDRGSNRAAKPLPQCTTNVGDGSKPEITAAQHWHPLQPDQQTLRAQNGGCTATLILWRDPLRKGDQVIFFFP